MTELIVLSVSGPAIAETQAHQKGQHERAHPECGIGSHSFLCPRPGLRLPRLQRSASSARRTRLQQPVGINPPPPDKFVSLTSVPCGGMPHSLPSPLRRMELRYRVGSSPLQASGARRSGEEVSIL
jgi:hypothetical protein